MNREHRVLVRRLHYVGEGKCNCCGRKRNYVEGGLLKCSRCKLAYFCSPTSQQQQWRAGHRRECRELGDIRVGDYVRLKKLVRRSELNCKVGWVVRPLTGGRWELDIRCQILTGMISVALKPRSH